MRSPRASYSLQQPWVWHCFVPFSCKSHSHPNNFWQGCDFSRKCMTHNTPCYSRPVCMYHFWKQNSGQTVLIKIKEQKLKGQNKLINEVKLNVTNEKKVLVPIL